MSRPEFYSTSRVWKKHFPIRNNQFHCPPPFFNLVKKKERNEVIFFYIVILFGQAKQTAYFECSVQTSLTRTLVAAFFLVCFLLRLAEYIISLRGKG